MHSEAQIVEAKERYDRQKRTFSFPRFWKLVDRKSDEECWLWQGAFHSSGYGLSPVSLAWNTRANRIALMIKLKRDLLPGMWSLHTCDVRACCNPSHLYEGTPKENRADVVRRGSRGRYKPLSVMRSTP